VFGDVWLHEGVKGEPFDAYPGLVWSDLPEDGRIWVELAALTSEIFLVGLYLALLDLAAERAASLLVSKYDAVGLGVIV
jgi:hypothetical protein